MTISLPKSDDIYGRVYTSLRSLEYSLGESLAGKQHREKGFYANIPWDYESFLEDLAVARAVLDHLHKNTYPYNRYSFVDAGCGLGIKVHMALRSFWDAHGVEINKKYRQIASALVSGGTTRIHLGDIRTHDYSPYNCIYFYQPMQYDSLMEQLTAQIIQTAKPKTLVISAWGNAELAQARGWQRLSSYLPPMNGWMYVKCSARALRDWKPQIVRQIH